MVRSDSTSIFTCLASRAILCPSSPGVSSAVFPEGFRDRASIAFQGYGDADVLSDVTLTVEKGQMAAIICSKTPARCDSRFSREALDVVRRRGTISGAQGAGVGSEAILAASFSALSRTSAVFFWNCSKIVCCSGLKIRRVRAKSRSS
jgi:hypothetical protein